ncbi:Hypothetical predicted protein [Olea europaea subsp. europaea]|uniref:Uncharacterized protein n=1 Tax=Olea europaea subsp. europaea TaxID=158383 RepID=A0A8S0TFK6_OLEEU|nr:Hypothetical predicted protein [Olea europaea subsp. europaea]
MKRQKDFYAEMQRRNRFDVVSEMQQQARGTVGINIVGRGGVLVGGQPTAISDPMAVIKMHYTKAEQFGVQNIVIEDDSWRSNGDVDSVRHWTVSNPSFWFRGFLVNLKVQVAIWCGTIVWSSHFPFMNGKVLCLNLFWFPKF